MKTKSPPFAALGLLLVWAMLLVAVPLTMNLFKTVKVEMPALTMALLSVFHLVGSLAIPCFVVAIAFLLQLRQKAGWFCALALCVACDFAVLGLILPVVSLWNSVGSTFSPLSQPGVGLTIGAFVLNQILFVLLLVKRREFVAAPKPEGALLPIQ